jgi:hypothetical protein
LGVGDGTLGSGLGSPKRDFRGRTSDSRKSTANRFFQTTRSRLTHLKGFLTACPDALEGYSYLTGTDDKAVLESYAAKLRALLLTRTDYPAMGRSRIGAK